MGHAKGDHVKSKKYIRIFLIVCMQRVVCLQNASVYQPKTYKSIAEIKDKVLYPGDSFIHTYSDAFYGKDNQPVAGTMIMLQVPVIDTRYFNIEQLSIISNTTEHGSHFNYGITLKCTVKNLLTKVSTTIGSYQTYNAVIDALWKPGLLNDFDQVNASVSATLAPSNSNASYVQKKIPDFIGEVFSLKDIDKKVLYPGDVIKVEKLMTTLISADKGLGSFEYILIPYRDYIELYQDPVTDDVLDQGWHKSTTDFYYIIKDNFPAKYTFDIMKWQGMVGYYATSNYQKGYVNLVSIDQITVNPMPDFFRLANDNPELRKILQKYLRSKEGCVANAQDDNKRTPLMWSIFYGQAGLVKHFLSDSFVSLVRVDKDGRTALMYAAERNNVEIARLLLAKDTASQSLPLQDKDGMTMLHYAVWNNNYSIVQDILAVKSMKSFINDVTIHGVTPLMYAAAQGNKRLVQLLLDNKADYTIVDKNGFNCLFYACMSLNVDFVKYLYAHILSDNSAMAQTMLQAVACDKTNIIYNTLLEGQSDNDFYEIIQFLLAQGLQPDSAYDSSKNSMLQTYLQSPTMQRGLYGTLLSLACSKGKSAKKTIQLLLQKGAKITTESFTLAQSQGVFDILSAYNSSAGPALYQALYKKDTTTALQIAQQYDPSLPVANTIVNYTNSGWSVLFLLALQAQGNSMANYNIIARELIKRGANVNIIGPDKQGNPITPLVWAVNNGNTELQNLLQTGGSKASQAVTHTIIMDTPVVNTNSPTGRKIRIQPNGLISDGATQISGVAIPENVISYDSVEYLLG